VIAKPRKNGEVARKPNSRAFLKPRSRPKFGKCLPEILPQRKSDRYQTKKDLQRSLDPFRYIKGMATVEMAVRGNAYQPCLRVIKKVEHRQNKNGIQQAVAVRLQRNSSSGPGYRSILSIGCPDDNPKN
jgi:hypothetical protein